MVGRRNTVLLCHHFHSQDTKNRAPGTHHFKMRLPQLPNGLALRKKLLRSVDTVPCFSATTFTAKALRIASPDTHTHHFCSQGTTNRITRRKRIVPTSKWYDTSEKIAVVGRHNTVLLCHHFHSQGAKNRVTRQTHHFTMCLPQLQNGLTLQKKLL